MKILCTNCGVRLKSLAFSLVLCPSLFAEEGGAGHYMPGGMGTLIDTPPTKAGWVSELIYLHFSGEASISRSFPWAGLLAAGLEATSDASMLGGFYTFEETLFGANAYLYEQVTGDSGRGATLGSFKSRSIGVGPTLSYILPVGENTLVTEVKWVPEHDTEKRLEGDSVWIKIAYQF